MAPRQRGSTRHRVRWTRVPPREPRSSSTPRCSAHDVTSTPCAGRTPAPASRGGCPPSRAAGARARPASERATPPADARGAGRASDRRRPHRPLSDARRRPDLLARRRLRRAGRDARRARLPEGGTSRGRACRAGGVPVRDRRARVDLLHRSRAGSDRAPTRDRARPRGDRDPWPDGPALLRPALPLPGRAARARTRQPDRGPAPRQVTQARHHGLSRPRHAGAVRGPVGVPLHLGAPHPEAGREARLGAPGADGRGTRRPRSARPVDQDPAESGTDRASQPRRHGADSRLGAEPLAVRDA